MPQELFRCRPLQVATRALLGILLHLETPSAPYVAPCLTRPWLARLLAFRVHRGKLRRILGDLVDIVFKRGILLTIEGCASPVLQELS